MREYIITVADPKVWDEVWDTLTKDGLSDNYIPSRGIEVLNERPFNDFCAHFNLTDDEADLIRQDSRFVAVELQADLRQGVEKGFQGTRPTYTYNKGNSTTNSMKNWGLIRSSNVANLFASASSVTADFTYNLDGTGVDVVVIDTGIEPDHPEFAVNADGTGGSRVADFDWSSLGVTGVPTGPSIGGYLKDSDGHGSNCASIIAGNTCGWASGATIYAIRIFTGYDTKTNASLGAISSDLAYDLVRAFHLNKIANGNTRPTICSNSWGYYANYIGVSSTHFRGTVYNGSQSATYGQLGSRHPYNTNMEYLNTAVDNASASGVIMVGAAGNFSHKIDVPGGIDYNNYYTGTYGNYHYHRGQSPTAASSMINVGALDNNLGNERKAYFSETGPRVDVYAPGVMIMGAYSNKAYQTVAVQDPRKTGSYLNKISGTSQATPQVAGVLACVLQARPTMTTAEAKAFLTEYSNKNLLTMSGTDSFANTSSLQSGNNRILRTPFTNPSRGSINS
jgi:subtilisin family serine protease